MLKMETNSLCKENTTKTSSQVNGTVADSTLKNERQIQTTTNEASSTTAKEVTSGGKGSKHGNAKGSVNFDDKLKIESDVEVSELLGSVITHNCPGVRTSARVIQKMKQDQTRPSTPPPTEREGRHKDEKSMQKTPSQVRTNKPTWTNLERNHFFDAINEFGKDFEAIGNYINMKLKRKIGTDISFKTKDQVRQHYYQTFHKICKYIRFSDEVKKPAQEMYALINYGEMRRKLQFVTDKHFIKLKNLVYQGHIIVRCKGKNIRIKTPSCKALRRLNQLDDSLEDIRLPSKIEVIVSPANMESFCRVQTIAQNPRARITVPLQKKLINFIKTFQFKWRSPEMKFAEEEAKLFPSNQGTTSSLEQNISDTPQHEKSTSSSTAAYNDPEMCFLPKPGVAIHRPLLSITEYLSSVNICLSAYEERMGVKVRGESLCHERPNNKRQRTESGSEKRSPDAKKQKNLTTTDKPESSMIAESISTTAIIKEEHNGLEGDQLKSDNSGSDYNGEDLSDELNDLLNDADANHETKKIQPCFPIREEPSATTVTNVDTPTTTSICSTSSTSSLSNTPSTTSSQSRSRRGTSSKARSSLTFKPLISEDVIRRIRKGWTISNAADITIGDLYVVFGQDSRLELDYYWTRAASGCSSSTSTSHTTVQTEATTPSFSQKQNGMPYNPADCDDPKLLNTLSKSSISNKLKHLLLIANLNERIRKRQCSCGHTCDKNSAKARIERDLATKTFISNKTFLPNNTSGDGNNIFRQPIVPIRRPVFNMDHMKQLSTISRPKMSRQVLVQRLLLPGGANHHELLNGKNLQNNIIGVKQEKSKLMAPMQNSMPQVTSTSLTVTRPQSPQNNVLITPTISEPSPMVANSSELSSDLFEAEKPLPNEGAALSQEMSGISILPEVQLTNNPVINVEQNEMDAATENLNDFSTPTSLPDSAFDESSNLSVFNGMSPMHLIRESSSNSRWLEENLNDFSLTSLLGHLDEINGSRDILDPSSNLSVISESSVDYMSKFQEITALMRSQDSD